MLQIAPAAPGDLDEVRALFREYSGLVSEALCFQGFDQELAALPGEYAPPGGTILLARDGGEAAGSTRTMPVKASRTTRESPAGAADS